MSSKRSNIGPNLRHVTRQMATGHDLTGRPRLNRNYPLPWPDLSKARNTPLNVQKYICQHLGSAESLKARDSPALGAGMNGRVGPS